MYTGKQVNKFAWLAGFCGLLLSVLACEPVLAIGWREAVLIFLLIAFLFGPPVYRFLRRLEKARERRKK